MMFSELLLLLVLFGPVSKAIGMLLLPMAWCVQGLLGGCYI